MRNSEAFQVLFGRAWTSFRHCLCGPAQVQQWARQIQGSWRSRRILSQGFLIRNQQENLLIVQICLVWHYWAKAMLLNAAVYNFSSKAPNFTGQSLAFLFALCCTVCSAAKVWASPEYHSCSCKRWQWDTFWIVNSWKRSGMHSLLGEAFQALVDAKLRLCHNVQEGIAYTAFGMGLMSNCLWHGAQCRLIQGPAHYSDNSNFFISSFIEWFFNQLQKHKVNIQKQTVRSDWSSRSCKKWKIKKEWKIKEESEEASQEN